MRRSKGLIRLRLCGSVLMGDFIFVKQLGHLFRNHVSVVGHRDEGDLLARFRLALRSRFRRRGILLRGNRFAHITQYTLNERRWYLIERLQKGLLGKCLLTRVACHKIECLAD